MPSLSLFWLSFPKGIRVLPKSPVFLGEAQRSRRTCGRPPGLPSPKGHHFYSPKRAPLLLAALLSTLPHHAQTPPKHKLFISPEDGVTFSYPATWLLNADDDAATAKLRLADYAPPHAVIQLEGNFAGQAPYAGTDFEAGAFAYTIIDADPPTCLTMLDPIATEKEKPIVLTWHGLPARRLDATFTVAGTDDLHTLVAAAEPARCMLFETVLIRKSVGLDIAPLSPKRWAALRAQFTDVLKSVRIARPTASPSPSPPKPV